MYIVISGNTGAGKSSLGNYVKQYLRPKVPIEYIDEKAFHHDLIQRMFENPTEYAFLIQINFLVQRSLKIQSFSEHKQVFLIERSLDEDLLFASRYYRKGNMNWKTFQVYRDLWEHCSSKVPAPSLYIYLYSDDPLVLTQRVTEDRRHSQTKQELPADQLQEYISEMNILYDDWFGNLQRPKLKLPIFTTDFEASKEFAQIVESILSLAASARARS